MVSCDPVWSGGSAPGGTYGSKRKQRDTRDGPRCVALVGPFQSGKTTLLEAILARTGVIQRQGEIGRAHV